jgi:hypothetical protein
MQQSSQIEVEDPLEPVVGQAVRLVRGRRLRLSCEVRRSTGRVLELEAVEPAPRSLRLRRRVAVEWSDELGLASAAATVRDLRDGGATIEVELSSPAELIQRREQIRVPAALDVEAWSLLEPTRLIAGTTIDLGAGGALLRLPGLPAATLVLDLRLRLPERTIQLRARIARRDPPEIAAVAFEHMPPADREAIVEYVVACLREPSPPAHPTAGATE